MAMQGPIPASGRAAMSQIKQLPSKPCRHFQGQQGWIWTAFRLKAVRSSQPSPINEIMLSFFRQFVENRIRFRIRETCQFVE
jgi:hypothetical protein